MLLVSLILADFLDACWHGVLILLVPVLGYIGIVWGASLIADDAKEIGRDVKDAVRKTEWYRDRKEKKDIERMEREVYKKKLRQMIEDKEES